MKYIVNAIVAACLLLTGFAMPPTTPVWVQSPVNGMIYSNPPTWPIRAQRSRFVYDPDLKQTIYAARRTGCNHYNDSLWAYDLPSNKFTMMTWSGSFPNPKDCVGSPAEDTPTYPSDRYNQSETYDTLRGRVVVYSDDCKDADMYHWFSSEPPYPATPAGMGWAADCNPCAPGIRIEASMTYTDPSRDLIVMYGGSRSGQNLADTWQYYGAANTWTRTSTSCAGPGCKSCGTNCSNLGPRVGHTLVYDPLNARVVLFGGYSHSATMPLNDTWEYDPDSQTWTNWDPPEKPPATKYPAMDFDSTRNIVWLHAAIAGQDCSAGCDWTYDAATHLWTKQPMTGGPVPKGPISQNSMFLGYDRHCDALVATVKETAMPTAMWYLPLNGALTCSQ
jgi:Galactose oxidase, central domain